MKTKELILIAALTTLGLAVSFVGVKCDSISEELTNITLQVQELTQKDN